MREQSTMKETCLLQKEVFRGDVLHVFCDEIALPNGVTSRREYARHRGAVAVLAIDEEENVLMERQYRYAVGAEVLEIPAGKLEINDKDPLCAAMRELKEETGAEAGKMKPLTTYIPSPAILTEKIYLYLAEDLTFGEQNLDHDENLTVEKMPLKTLVKMILDGEIRDGKTQSAVMQVYLTRYGKEL